MIVGFTHENDSAVCFDGDEKSTVGGDAITAADDNKPKSCCRRDRISDQFRPKCPLPP